MIGNVFRVIQGWIRIKGGTDGTFIGNSSDSLKTTITSSALPSGASTEAKQDTGNTSLSSIDGKLTDNATATKQDSLISQQTSTNSKLDTLNAKDFSTGAKQDTGNSSLNNIDGKVSTEAKQDTQITAQGLTNTKLDTNNASLSSIDGKVSTSANQTVLNSRVGDLTETSPVSDTASSGLNGRLQRIAQRISSLITGLISGDYQIEFKGATDGTKIGNQGNRLLTSSLLEDKNRNKMEISNFSELRVAQRNVDVEIKFYYNINTKTIVTGHLNGGNASVVNRQAVLNTSTAANGKALVRSLRTNDYRVSQAIEASVAFLAPDVTGVAGSQTGVANNRMLWGVIDRLENNGVYWGFDGNQSFSIFYKRDGVETKINKVSFNMDKLDGVSETNGIVSQYNPDFTKLQLIRVMFSWHGVTPFIFEIQNAMGEWVAFHIVSFVNNTTTSSIGVPILSPFSSVQNSGNTTNIQTIFQAGQISFLGNRNEDVSVRFFSLEAEKTVSTTAPVLSLRSKDTYFSLANVISSVVDWLAISADGNKPVTVRIYKNASLTGAVFSDVDAVNSIIQADSSATAFTGGDYIISFRIGASGSYNNSVRDLEMRLQPNDVLTFTAQSQSNNNVSIGARWRELH